MRDRVDNRGLQPARFRDPLAFCATQLRVCRKARVVQVRLPDRPLAGALLLGDLAELRVVEQDVSDIHLVLDCCRQLTHVLAKSAVAADRHDLASAPLFVVTSRRPCAHRGRKRETDRTKVAGHQDRLVAAFKIPAERIGVVADVDRDNGIRRNRFGQRREYRRRIQPSPAVIGQSPPFFLRARSPSVRRLPVADRPYPSRPRASRAAGLP